MLAGMHTPGVRPRGRRGAWLGLGVLALLLCASCAQKGVPGARAYLEEQGFTDIDVSPSLASAIPGMEQEGFLFTGKLNGQDCRGTVTGQTMLGCRAGYGGVWDCGSADFLRP